MNLNKNNGKQYIADPSCMLQHATDGIILADLNGNLIDANPAICEMLMFTKDEMLSRKLATFFLPEDLKTNPLHFKEALEGKPVRSERRLLRHDGSFLFVDISGKLLPDNNLFAIIRDISLQKLAEAKLKESEAKFRNLFTESPVGKVIVGDERQLHLRYNDN